MLGKEARDGAVGNHSPASADYSLRRKMRFLSHRNSVIKIKYNVWLDSAKWTSAGACVHFTEMPDKKHDLKQCASSKSEEVGGGGYRKEVGKNTGVGSYSQFLMCMHLTEHQTT